MFECGLEDFNLKAARRVGYSSKGSQQDEENLQHISRLLSHTQDPSPVQPTFSTPPPVPDSDQEDGSDMASNHSTVGSASANSADDERSWQSRVSMDSHDTTGENQAEVENKQLEGDASSCSLEFKTVWFNFAAPPPSPKKKKLEFTR